MKMTTSQEIEKTVQVTDTGIETIHADEEGMPMTNGVIVMMDNDIEKEVKRRTGIEGGGVTMMEAVQNAAETEEEERGSKVRMWTKGEATIEVTGNGGKVLRSTRDREKVVTKETGKRTRTTDEVKVTERRTEMKVQKTIDAEANVTKEGGTEKVQIANERSVIEIKVLRKMTGAKTNKIKGGKENGHPKKTTGHVKVEMRKGEVGRKVRKLM